jgi:hypothetical protein
MHECIKWLLTSDIRIKKGKHKGALYGWKNFNPTSFPFIYSEVTGYAISFFSWISIEFSRTDALKAAKDSCIWISKNMRSHLVVAKPPGSPNQRNELSDVYYSFDNGMILIGLVNLYKLTREYEILKLAEKLAQALIDRFYDGQKLVPRLDHSYNSMMTEHIDGIVKWSTVPGPYHSKLSIGLLELSSLTDNSKYSEVSNSICSYALKCQSPEGQFITNPRSDIVYLHPHLYACEGLIYSGLRQSNDQQFNAGLHGIKWAINQLATRKADALFQNTGRQSAEQSDCTAQLLRLLLLCTQSLKRYFSDSELNNIIDRVHSRLLDFYMPFGQGQGAIKYQFALDTACSWCTMFSAQALNLWKSKNSHTMWMDYFV